MAERFHFLQSGCPGSPHKNFLTQQHHRRRYQIYQSAQKQSSPHRRKVDAHSRTVAGVDLTQGPLAQRLAQRKRCVADLCRVSGRRRSQEPYSQRQFYHQSPFASPQMVWSGRQSFGLWRQGKSIGRLLFETPSGRSARNEKRSGIRNPWFCG